MSGHGDSSPEARAILRHVVATIAYRTQKAIRGAPENYADFEAGNDTRTPVEILRHMTSLMGYARTHFVGGSYPRNPPPLDSWAAEVERFHAILGEVADLLDSDAALDVTTEQLLQGPLADTLTHVGQLAMLRRLAGSPVPPESFIHADVRPDHLGPDQPPPAAPDVDWPERPREGSDPDQGP